MSEPTGRSGTPLKADGPPKGPDEPRSIDRPSQRPGGAESLVGTRLVGRYLIERLLGNGGMGDVYLAEHLTIRKKVAIKVLHPEMSRMKEVVARFEREALAAAHIEHPNVAAASDFGKLDDGSFFLVLEYIEGQSLRQAIGGGPLELTRALHVARQIASALARAHSLGIVHRDLKPENVMLVTRDGDPNFVKVLDFGIAKVPVGEILGEAIGTGQALTQLGMVYGTPEYMAPEQALGQAVDARADLYALGVILFEMLAGTRPFDDESKVAILGMHVTAPVPSLKERAPEAGVTSALDEIVARLMAKEVRARFADAKELIDALDVEESRLALGARATTPAPASSMAFSTTSAGGPLAGLTPAPLPLTPAAEPRPLALPSRGSRVLSLIPVSARPRVLTIGAVAAAILVLVTAALEMTAHSPIAPSSAPLDAGPAALPSAAARTEAAIGAAASKIEKGDFATAIEELGVIEKTDPNRASVHMLLERAYTGTRNPREATREAGLWLAADGSAAGDLKLEEDVRNAALLKDAQDDAFALLESKMGAVGVDILYDIAFGTSGRLYPQAAARARRSIEDPAVRSRASLRLALVFDFRESKGCDQKHALLDRARTQGDSRLMPLLQPLESKRGCGFLARSDCYPCMRHDTMLADAIAAISARAPASP
ncbi:MAG: protein kinase [Polyangiaceae bacterium]|jgi:serine/threonine-protein kinase